MSQRAGNKFPVTSSREDTLPEGQWMMDYDNYEEVSYCMHYVEVHVYVLLAGLAL